ncbi:hypothetical protein SCHPADRAFT_900968 [Schizopora paradoxa]|uniref:Uncharacterized protein n=1 Tax=Schizopora paradoxa TaxID=27342 RepID=A0A0H2RZG2_9AGAM|nr:hypothetical protein SCHPADRAFT_900968 [Schizopora paradoxa]
MDLLGRWTLAGKREAHAAIDAAENSIAPRKMHARIQKAGMVFRAIFDEVNPCFGQVFISKRPRMLQGGGRMGKKPRGTTETTLGLHRLVIVSECAISKASRCHNDDPTAGACLYARIYARHDTDFGTFHSFDSTLLDALAQC